MPLNSLVIGDVGVGKKTLAMSVIPSTNTQKHSFTGIVCLIMTLFLYFLVT